VSIRQDLDLDIQSALAEVSNLEAALSAALAAASETLASSIASAVEGLPDLVPTITPEVDTTSAVATVLSDVESVAPLVTADVTTDVGLIQDEITTGVESVAPTVTPIADSTEIVSEIGTALDAAAAQPINTAPIAEEIAQAVTDGASAGFDTLGASVPSLDAVGAAAEKAGGQVETAFSGGTSAAGAFDFAVAGASGSIAKTAGGFTKLIPGAAIIGSVAAATGTLFSKAEGTRASLERLEIVFGENADAVQKIDINGFNTELVKLTRAAGSSAANVRQAAANFGLFAQGFGASDEATVKTTKQLEVLALRAVALNPSLGSAFPSSKTPGIGR
jgi:hypothetical protein